MEFDIPSDFDSISCLELIEERVNIRSIEEDRMVWRTSSMLSCHPGAQI